MSTSKDIDAIVVLENIKHYRNHNVYHSGSTLNPAGSDYYKFDDIQNFNWFLHQVELMATVFVPVEEGEIIYTEEKISNIVSGIGSGAVLSKKEVKRMEKEIRIIEKHYPGDQDLDRLEKLVKVVYDSVHAFQYLVARHRKGEVDIYFDEDEDLCITTNE